MFFVCLAMCETEEEKTKFEEIYNCYIGFMLVVASKYSEDGQDVEDVLQDTCEILLHNLKKITEIDSAMTKSYISTIIKHLYYNKTKRKVRGIRASNALKANEELKKFDIPNNNWAGLEVAISKLSFDHREVLKLKYLYRLPDEECAASIKISKAAVRKRLERARNALKDIIIKEGLRK